jgi:uncharacterized protein YjbI with pentapeptide repeats
VHLKDVDLGESKLRAVEFVDVIADRVDAADGDWGGAQLRRMLFSDARLTGLSFAEARIEEVSFKACKLDYANFRHSEIERVSFEDCVLTGVDFQEASIKAMIFSGCQLVEADFSKAAMSLVDLRGSELRLAGSVLGLRGALPALAREGAYVRGEVELLGPDLLGERCELTLRGPWRTRGRCRACAATIEICEAFEQELRPWAGRVTAVEQAVIEAEDGHDVVVASSAARSAGCSCTRRSRRNRRSHSRTGWLWLESCCHRPRAVVENPLQIALDERRMSGREHLAWGMGRVDCCLVVGHRVLLICLSGLWPEYPASR